MADYADLPGAPPASDTAAWAPAGGPQGAAPDSSDFNAVLMPDLASMSPQARHDFRAMLAAGGTRSAFDLWAAKYVQQTAAGAPPPGADGASPSDGLASSSDGEAPPMMANSPTTKSTSPPTSS